MEQLRAEFPVLARVSYLNAGTNGPVPRRALEAARASLSHQAEHGRSGADFFHAILDRMERLRARMAGLLGCDTSELALTGSTTDGVNAVLAALDLGRGDEVLTTVEEHPGILAPLGMMRERRGVRVKSVPFAEVAAHVGPETRLVACSHVSWVTGAVVDAPALAATSAPVMLDGAQALGAVPVDVHALGCDFYAASGQKWLCGPNGAGYLYVRADRCRSMPAPWPGYGTVADSSDPLGSGPQPDARRFDLGFPGDHDLAWALASLDVLEEAGLDAVHARAADLAAGLASDLAGVGVEVAPRARSTLVSWRTTDPPAEVLRLREQGFVLRDLPGTPYVRASVGAWSSEEELGRLVELASARV